MATPEQQAAIDQIIAATKDPLFTEDPLSTVDPFLPEEAEPEEEGLFAAAKRKIIGFTEGEKERIRLAREQPPAVPTRIDFPALGKAAKNVVVGLKDAPFEFIDALEKGYETYKALPPSIKEAGLAFLGNVPGAQTISTAIRAEDAIRTAEVEGLEIKELPGVPSLPAEQARQREILPGPGGGIYSRIGRIGREGERADAAYREALFGPEGVFSKEEELVKQKAIYEAEFAGKQRDLLEEQRLRQKDLERRREDTLQGQMKEYKTLQQEVSDTKLDPGRWFSSKSTPEAVGIAILAAISGFAGGYTKNPNLTRWIGDAIDRDLMAQREDLTTQKATLAGQDNLMARTRQAFDEEDMALKAARALAWDQLTANANLKMKELGEAGQLSLDAQETINQLDLKRAEANQEFERAANQRAFQLASAQAATAAQAGGQPKELDAASRKTLASNESLKTMISRLQQEFNEAREGLENYIPYYKGIAKGLPNTALRNYENSMKRARMFLVKELSGTTYTEGQIRMISELIPQADIFSVDEANTMFNKFNQMLNDMSNSVLGRPMDLSRPAE